MSAPTCQRCGRTEGTPSSHGKPIRINRTQGLCRPCLSVLHHHPDAPLRKAPKPPRTCQRCGRTSKAKTSRGNPLRIYGPGAKYAGYCYPCATIMRDFPHRPLPAPTPRKCRICKRRTSRNGRPLTIIKGGKWPGLCTSCRGSMVRRTRTYPAKPCISCGRTHTSTGRLVELTRTGPYAGLCITCRHHKHKELTQA